MQLVKAITNLQISYPLWLNTVYKN
jgi:hypothetical protein